MSREAAAMRRLVLAIVLPAALAGCDPRAGDKPPAGVVNGAPPSVLVSRPVVRTVSDFEAFTGRTEASATVEVRARASGYLLKLGFKDGDTVEKDQVLFEIDPRPYQADLDKSKADLALAEARQKRTEADYNRALSLSRTPGAISQQEIDKYLADRNEAVAATKSSQAAIDRLDLNLKWTKVTAPIAGRASRRLVDVGNLVTQDSTVLTTIVAEDPMYAYFDVDERTLLKVHRMIREGRIKSATESTVPVRMALADEEGYPHEGSIDFVNNQVDPSTGTLRLRATFTNPSEHGIRALTSGEFCRVRVQIGDPYPAKLVAERAILKEQTRTYVMVADSQDVARQKDVTLGPPQADGLRVIASGLEADDRVIVEGMTAVRDGAKVTPREVPMPGSGK